MPPSRCPTARKGEQIVLVTDADGARRVDLVGWAQNHGVTELAVPRQVLVVPRIRCWAPARPIMSASKNTSNANWPRPPRDGPVWSVFKWCR